MDLEMEYNVFLVIMKEAYTLNPRVTDSDVVGLLKGIYGHEVLQVMEADHLTDEEKYHGVEFYTRQFHEAVGLLESGGLQ